MQVKTWKVIKHTSRGKNSDSYPIVSIRDHKGCKLGQAMGNGYDLFSAALAEAIETQFATDIAARLVDGELPGVMRSPRSRKKGWILVAETRLQVEELLSALGWQMSLLKVSFMHEVLTLYRVESETKK